MSGPNSVTAWINELKAGNHEAAQKLWERYFRRLVGLARSKLKGMPRRVADAEDVALSVLDSFCRGAQHGRFPQLRDRNNLWPLLLLITKRKAIDLIQAQRAQKRGGGKVQGESALLILIDSSAAGIENVLDREPTPQFAAEVAEECQRLVNLLNDDRLREIAILKMEGYTDKEVAAKLNCGIRTVERKLERARAIWAKEITP